jgi:hypothetical protein
MLKLNSPPERHTEDREMRFKLTQQVKDLWFREETDFPVVFSYNGGKDEKHTRSQRAFRP